MEVSYPISTHENRISNEEISSYFRACQSSDIRTIEQLWPKLTNELKRVREMKCYDAKFDAICHCC